MIIKGSNVSNNTTSGEIRTGGGIVNSSGGTLSLLKCSIENNSAAPNELDEMGKSSGGGLYNAGNAEIKNSTINNNVCIGVTIVQCN